MMRFVFITKPHEYLHGLLRRRGIDSHRLEPAFQSGVLLNIFAVFVKRGRAYGLHFSSGQHGLNYISCVYSAFGSPCAHQSMHFVYKQYYVARFFQLVYSPLKPLFKFTAVFCARQHACKIQSYKTLVFKVFRHAALNYFLSEPFYYR